MINNIVRYIRFTNILSNSGFLSFLSHFWYGFMGFECGNNYNFPEY
jgi:hypothetical protein